MNDLDLLRQHDPAAGSVPLLGRDDLLRALRTTTTRRGPRRWMTLAVAGAALTVGSGGLAYAVLTGQPPATALKVNCSAGASEAEFVETFSFTSVMDVSTGDPVADCASEYQRLGLPVPALRGYESGSVFIWVVPQSWKVPASWRPLAEDFRSDTNRLTLKQRIEDPIDGPGVGCPSTAAVRKAVNDELAALHLEDWSVVPAPGGTDGDGSTMCAFAFLDEEGDNRIYLQAGPPMTTAGDDKGPHELMNRLRADVARPCLTMPQAKAATAKALADTGVPATVLAAPTASGRCTSIDLVPGGLITIRLS